MKVDLFDEQYKKLNKGQKEAVETVEGPVMVIAGPGTGKLKFNGAPTVELNRYAVAGLQRLPPRFVLRGACIRGR